jgi:AraC-like DNA-binding protein
MTDPELPLVKAAFLAPFRMAMESNGISADVYFRKFRLPASEIEDPAALIPEKPFWQLINQVAIAEMIPDFGMQVAQAMPWSEIDTLKPLLAGRRPLKQVLETFCAAAGKQSNTSGFKLRLGNDICWFESRGQVLVSNDIQMESYRVTSMIELVQLAAGINWRPLTVHLTMDENRVIYRNHLLEGCAVVFSRPRTAIAMPAGLLNANVSLNPDLAGNGLKPIEEIHDKSEFMEALRTVIGQYVQEDNLSVGMIAELTGCSTRTLQRLLKQYDVSYKNLLNEARKNFAMANLEHSRLPITDIAHKLGYTDAGHFTRAFRRWTGMTPTQYRKSH